MGKFLDWLSARIVADQFGGKAEHVDPDRCDHPSRERLTNEQADLDARVAALPAPLKARIERFRAQDPKFRIDVSEMAAIGDAPKIARGIAAARGWRLNEDLKAQDITGIEVKQAVQAFYDLTNEKREEMVPDLDEGHSGSTFAVAVALAHALLAGDPV